MSECPVSNDAHVITFSDFNGQCPKVVPTSVYHDDPKHTRQYSTIMGCSNILHSDGAIPIWSGYQPWYSTNEFNPRKNHNDTAPKRYGEKNRHEAQKALLDK